MPTSPTTLGPMYKDDKVNIRGAYNIYNAHIIDISQSYMYENFDYAYLVVCCKVLLSI